MTPLLARAFVMLLLALPFAAQKATTGYLGLEVRAHAPAAQARAPVNTPISFTFDLPLRRSTINATNFRVFGRESGPMQGSFSFSNLDRTVTFVPARAFAAGEAVSVNLSHDVRNGRGDPLRQGGYAFQFWTAAAPSVTGSFTQYAALSTRPGVGHQFLAAAGVGDLNHDGALDLVAVNSGPAEVRALLNLDDGLGSYGPILSPASMSPGVREIVAADFNNNGETDFCTPDYTGYSVYRIPGLGGGAFGTPRRHDTLSGLPLSIAVLDVDGDGDMDIATGGTSQLNPDVTILRNDLDHGGGFLAIDVPPGLVDSYGLAAGDMNGDGIADLVVAADFAGGWELVTLLGNGDGTFHPAGASLTQNSGTYPMFELGDVDGDGDIDLAVGTTTGARILKNKGNGTFVPQTAFASFSIFQWLNPPCHLGDLDGDGDLDCFLQSRVSSPCSIYRNDGTGGFSFWQDVPAAAVAQNAVLLDTDGDGDLDVAATNSDTDLITLVRND